MNKFPVTISLFLEIKDAERFGGKGEIGYANANFDLDTENFENVDLEDMAAEQMSFIAELNKVPVDNVRIISRREYRENTDDD